MTESSLYTVNVYQLNRNETDTDEVSSRNGDDNQLSTTNLTDKMKYLDKYINMISAKILNGNMIELEHTKLVGNTVKFKTVVDYNKALTSKDSLAIVMIPQNTYLASA